MTLDKLCELIKSDLSGINSFHFLNPFDQVPLRDSAYYTFAYNDNQDESGYTLVRRRLVDSLTGQHEGIQGERKVELAV